MCKYEDVLSFLVFKIVVQIPFPFNEAWKLVAF